MIVIQPYRGQRGHSRDRARMIIDNGGRHLVYFPSSAAAEIILAWHEGMDVAWEVDDHTRQPHTVHLSASIDRGFKLSLANGDRPVVSIPTSEVGRALRQPAGTAGRQRAQTVDEIEISTVKVSVKVPFAFEVQPR